MVFSFFVSTFEWETTTNNRFLKRFDFSWKNEWENEAKNDFGDFTWKIEWERVAENFESFFHFSFCYTGFTELYVLLIGWKWEGLPVLFRFSPRRERERERERAFPPAIYLPNSFETYLGSEWGRSSHLPPLNWSFIIPFMRELISRSNFRGKVDVFKGENLGAAGK